MSALLQALAHPSELAALVDFLACGGKQRLFPKMDMGELTPSMCKCYDFLDKTSRSFAAVIKALDAELRPSICLFYLILRGLDTIEDDMSLDPALKDKLLRSFHEQLYVEGWTFDGSGPAEKDRHLLVGFHVVIAEFLRLDVKFQNVIADITKRMGNGMADFASKGTVATVQEYNLYCHYVAGLVGIGLSGLFSASGLEAPEVAADVETANSMGLFLQKTNIIRDYLEDLEEGRTWWPEEVWSKYAGSLSALAAPQNREQALHCLNDLVTDALTLVPEVFDYMGRLHNQTVFNFCAIPQVMAIATLSLVYQNPKVFQGNVKIRKGEAVSLMMRATNMAQLHLIFEQYASQIEKQIPDSDPSAKRTAEAVAFVKDTVARLRAAGVVKEAPLRSSSAWAVPVAIIGLGATVGLYLFASS